MSKDRSLVRASDIGAWTFCQRAWWLAQVQKVAHQNPAVLLRGETAHQTHGRQVQRAHHLRRWGTALVALSLLLGALLLFAWLLNPA